MIHRLRTLYLIWFIGLLLAVVILILGGCGSSPVAQRGLAIDQDLERYNRAARQAFDKGRLQQAATYYRKALDRAYIGDDSGAIIDAQYNLAVCLMKLQSYEEALGVVRQAKAEMARADQSNSADFLLLEATILQRTGNSEHAWNITDQILATILATTPPASSIIFV